MWGNGTRNARENTRLDGHWSMVMFSLSTLTIRPQTLRRVSEHLGNHVKRSQNESPKHVQDRTKTCYFGKIKMITFPRWT